MVYGVAMVSYMCTSFKYLMATFDAAKVDTPGRIDADSMEVLGYVMITLDLIVIVGAFVVVVMMFVFFKKKLATIARKGKGKAKGGGAGSGNKNSLVRVQPIEKRQKKARKEEKFESLQIRSWKIAPDTAANSTVPSSKPSPVELKIAPDTAANSTVPSSKPSPVELVEVEKN